MKRLYTILAVGILPLSLCAQSAIDAFRFTQPDMKGTARFMSMGGAFGALGGDLSTLSQNPAGIGVYRSSEVGLTFDLDFQRATSDSYGMTQSVNKTKFLLNNIGGVATLRLPSSAMPNLNFGFTYNKAASFNRQYAGSFGRIENSMSNYIAGICNENNITVADVTSTNTFDPYFPNDGGYEAPWISILGYDSYLVNPEGDPDNPQWTGQWGSKTSGNAGFSVMEKGGVDEYNIAIGGNIANKVYWGMNFDIINFNYSLQSLWMENLTDAYISEEDGTALNLANNHWSLRNLYQCSGSGFNYQLGVIVKPIQELRFGLAFHTPTVYNLTETYYARVNYDQPTPGYAETNNGMDASNSMNFRSPWKVIASVAGVIGSKLIISADYEWANYGSSKFSTHYDYDYGYDYGYDDWWGMPAATKATPAWDYSDPYYATNKDIKTYYQSVNTLRVGAEYRVTNQFSVRAGYSFVSSPVTDYAKNGSNVIYTSGTMPNYTLDNSTNYVTAGLGYRYKKFYIDLAYVYKHLSSEYHAYTPDPDYPSIPSPTSKLSLNNHQLVMSLGFKL